MKVDAWDAVGAAGAALLGAGVWAQWGWPWAAMLWGSLVLGVYVIRELAAARRRKGA